VRAVAGESRSDAGAVGANPPRETLRPTYRHSEATLETGPHGPTNGARRASPKLSGQHTERGGTTRSPMTASKGFLMNADAAHARYRLRPVLDRTRHVELTHGRADAGRDRVRRRGAPSRSAGERRGRQR